MRGEWGVREAGGTRAVCVRKVKERVTGIQDQRESKRMQYADSPGSNVSINTSAVSQPGKG